MRILVTGATGRIGHRLVELLTARSENVRALVVPGDPLRHRIEGKGVEIVEGVLSDRDRLKRLVEDVGGVIHLAALLPQGRSADELFETNIRGTFNLLEALLPHASQIRRFIMASTDNVYPDDRGLRYLPVDEYHPRLNNDPYGISKIVCEDLCLGYMRRCGLPVTIPRFGLTLSGDELLDPNGIRAPLFFLKPFLARLRESMPSNPIDKAALESLATAGGTGIQLVIARDPNGRPAVEMINDPRNVAEGLLLLLDNDIATGEVFHLMAPHAFAYDEFVHAISGLTGWPIVEVTVSSVLHLDFSNAKARAMLGYRPTRTVFDMVEEAWLAQELLAP